LVQEITDKQENDSEEVMKTIELVRERVSFKGIYMLHDDIKSAMVAIDQNQQAFQSLE